VSEQRAPMRRRGSRGGLSLRETAAELDRSTATVVRAEADTPAQRLHRRRRAAAVPTTAR